MAAKKTTTKKIATKRTPIQAFAFIDTNVFLDFYRGSAEASLTLLEKLGSVSDRIISTYQVEMEFLKNRQQVLLAAVDKIKHNIDGSVPAVLTKSGDGDLLKALRTSCSKTKKKISERASLILSNPSKDRVYSTLSEIFQSDAGHVLTREMPVRKEIKEQAIRRFQMGYPPRKPDDTSYGDALNWEWVLHCAKTLKGRIYVVSRDGDYGCEHNNTYYLNDHLKKEFRDRIGKKSIIYTRKLSDVLKALSIPITPQEERAEESSMVIENPPVVNADTPVNHFIIKLLQQARALREQRAEEYRQRPDLFDMDDGE